MDANTSDDYDIFLSYRSGHSSRYAEQVKSSLHSLNRRHATDQPIRIFLDKSSLSAGALNDNIKGPLLRSRNLVVLLDQTTRDSRWVEEEIATWLAHGGDPELFLVRTSPELDLSWGEGGFAHPEQLPKPLRTAFDVEQKWFDLSSAPRALDDAQLAGLYAAGMNVNPELLLLEEARYQQRQRRRNRRILAGLAGLLVVALVAEGLAVVNGQAASLAARQAQAEADASQALLALPLSYPQAAELAASAAWNSDSTSVRATLLSVATGLGPLQRTLSFTQAASGGSIQGINFDAAGQRLLAWGRPVGSDGTELVVWDVTSGDVMAQFTVPIEDLYDVVELPRRAYLGCSRGEPLRIDWTTHEVVWLSQWGPPSDEEPEGGCRVTAISTAVAIQFGVESLGSLYAETITGVTVMSEGLVDEGSTGRMVAGVLDWDDDEGTDRVGAILSASGLTVIKAEDRGVLLNQVEDQFFVRSGDRFHALALGDDGVVVTDLGVHPEAKEAAGIIDTDLDVSTGRSQREPQLAWIDAAGRVGLSDGGSVQLADPATVPADGDARPYTAVITSGDRVFGVMGTSLWRLDRPDSGDPARHPVLLPGLLRDRAGADGAGDGDAPQRCGDVALFEDGTYLVGLDFSNPVLHRSMASAAIENCHVLQSSPPMTLDAVVIVNASAPPEERRSVAPDGTMAVADAAGLIQVVSPTDEEAQPWRIYPVEPTSTLYAGAGTRTLSAQDGELVLSGPDGAQRFKVEGAQWARARPDGLGGIYVADDWAFAGVGTTGYEPLDSRCAGIGIAYLPEPGFTESIVAAERQRLVTTSSPHIDCLSGQEVWADLEGELVPNPDSYVIGATGGHLVWADEENVSQVTWWVRGDSAGPTTTALPAEVGWAAPYALDETATRLLIGDGERNVVDDYRRKDGQWVLAQTFSVTLGQIAAVAHNPDQSLVVALADDGAFNIFDADSGRLLAAEYTGPVSGDFVRNAWVTEADGLMYIYLWTNDDNVGLIEVPVGVERLRELICGIHVSEYC